MRLGLFAALAALASACGENPSTADRLGPNLDAEAISAFAGIDASSNDARVGIGLSADAGSDAGACLFLASNYDQSCSVDSDCALVVSTDYCGDQVCQCPDSPISLAGRDKFNADIANTPLGSGMLQWPVCACEAPLPVCCSGGSCTTYCGGSSSTCGAAGGSCMDVTSCPHGAGPADSCPASASRPALLCCLN